MIEKINYTIYQEVYDEMISGRKTIEIRLLNEKSSKIQIGDLIKFSVLNNDKYIVAKVLNKYLYDSIDDLWNDKDKLLNSSIKYSKSEFKEALNNIFGKEIVKNSKLIGIEFKIM